MNINDTANQLLYTTVPIWVENKDGTQSVGTGFIYSKKIDNNSSIPLIVTNKHVVFNAIRGMIALVKGINNQPQNNERITVELDANLLNGNIHPVLDIAIFPFGPILNQLKDQGINIFFKSITNEIIPTKEVADNLSAIEDITFIGYPSGLYDRKNNSPIIRQGITASPYWNDFEGQPIFLIDAGVYPGSSGSPVFIYNRGTYPTNDGIAVGNRVLFLGILAESIIRTENDKSRTYIGLGRVIKSIEVQNFIEEKLKNVK